MDLDKLRDLFASGYGRRKLAQTLGTTEWQIRKALKSPPAQANQIPLTAKPTRILAFGDTHCPFHDESAIAATLGFIKQWKPHIIVMLGDIIDFGAVSRFDQTPEGRLSLQEDIDAVIELFQQVRLAAGPNAQVYTVEGNHESRFSKYLIRKAPELYQLRQLTVPYLLEFESMGIKWIPVNQELHVESFMFLHGDVVRKWGGYTAQAMLDKFAHNVVFGHTHRLAIAYRTFQDRTFVGVEAGCLIMPDNPGYDCRYPNWQQGLVAITMHDAVDYHVELHRIHQGRLMLGG